MKRKTPKFHEHVGVSATLCGLVLGTIREMSGTQGWFYAGKIGSELKIGITKGCPFCRMDQQYLHYLGIAFSEDCLTHESRMKKALGKPSHGKEYFSDWQGRFDWLRCNRYIRSIEDVTIDLARELDYYERETK